MALNSPKVLATLRFALLSDFFAFSGTALVDTVRFWDAQAATILLRFAVGIISLVAWRDVGRLSRGRQRKPWEFPSVVASQASALPLLFIPISIELSSRVHDRWDIGVFCITLLLLIVAVVVLFGAIMEHPAGLLKGAWVVVVALLPLAGAIQFWYLTFFKPTYERPRVNVVAHLDDVGRYKGVTHMRATVELENIGAAEVNVLGAMYTVTGHAVESPDHVLTNGELSANLGMPWRVTSADLSPFKGLVKIGRLVRPGGHLTPGQKFSTSFVFDVKNDAQEKLRLTVHLSLLTRIGSDLGPFKPCESHVRRDGAKVNPEITLPEACFQTAVPAQSWLRLELGDRPVARTAVIFPMEPSRGQPYMQTRFQYVDREVADEKGLRGIAQLGEIDPFVVSRGFTSSVEYRLDP
ncbi:hypothetical protein AB0B01_05365 [Streptomyces sp. NPDC044571]|uniref:hypothetical protein n=1 Tax=Streptomyces sp. NPDC044571 TaxID=3155371 RepID=UPI0033CF2CF6